MFHHTSSLAFTKQESVEFQHLQQSYVNSNQSNNDNIIYGVEIPNRVFVGGVPYDTTELELKNFFQSFGGIKDVKIITDRDGISERKTIYYKEKKLNIGPAIRKQGGQFPKANQEFLTGQIKIFINSSHSPVYTPSSSDKISPMIYSLSPSHYMQSIPYCHHNDSPTPYFPDPTPAQTPSPLHSLQTFHFPHYPILLPPEGFFSSHDHSESPTSTWYKMAKQFPEDRRLSEKHHFTQIEPAFKKMSIKKHEVEPTGQLTPPPSPESV